MQERRRRAEEVAMRLFQLLDMGGEEGEEGEEEGEEDG